MACLRSRRDFDTSVEIRSADLFISSPVAAVAIDSNPLYSGVSSHDSNCCVRGMKIESALRDKTISIASVRKVM
jgi:hypothetical protein